MNRIWLKKTVLVLLAVCLIALMPCEKLQAAVYTEGPEESDTGFQITGYSGYADEKASCFLKEGDRIAVVALTSIPTEEQIAVTLEGLTGWGYVPVEGAHLHAQIRTLEDTVSDLEWALTDPDIRAIFCVKGGYGSSEVLDLIPEGMIASANKMIIGYSDVTACHAAWSSAGIPSVHASMAAAFGDLPPECAEAQRRMLRGEIPVYRCAGSGYDKEGTAEGILIGGNLSTLPAVLESAYDCTKMDQPYILFLEDIGEDIRHLHRYLTILKHHKVLENASGLLFGEWFDMRAEGGVYDGASRGGYFASVDEMISRQFLAESDIPAAFGFPAGHDLVNYPLLMGKKARLTVSDSSYTLAWIPD